MLSSVSLQFISLTFDPCAFSQEGGVSFLTTALENCLEVQWKEQYECVVSPEAPPISLEASQRIVEILKILFNITYSAHRQEPSEVSQQPSSWDTSNRANTTQNNTGSPPG